MQRWCRAALLGCGFFLLALAASFAAPLAAGASGISVRVTPNQGLVGGQSVTVSGRGLGKPPAKGAAPWFVIECTDLVKGHMNPATDTPHCDLTRAETLKISGNGSFSTHFRLTTGIVGDGYCGTPGHATCVIAVTSRRTGPGTRGRSCPSPSRSLARHPRLPARTEVPRPGAADLRLVQPLQVVEADDAPQPDADRLLQVVREGRPARDRGRLCRCR